MPYAAGRFASGFACGVLVSLLLPALATSSIAPDGSASTYVCSQTNQTNFLVMAGGGSPASNEIALEKNVLYFQRTLQALGFDPTAASLFFANGNDGQATVRYLDEQRQEQFRAPEIPHLAGAATLNNLYNWLQNAQTEPDRPVFFYFTGHGSRNPDDLNNNAMILWGQEFVSVQQFAQMLDELPSEMPIVTVMAQCYSGSFANFIYQGGDPNRSIALQTRCGFFATVKTNPSVGCTPEVNEADYRDYSSSFFAGLSGRSRTGEPVASADYDRNGRVSYAEAHAFAKVDEQTTDLPVSTVEVWLQEQASESDQSRIFSQPIATTLATARPEQRYTVEAIAEKLNFDLQQTPEANLQQAGFSKLPAQQAEVAGTFLTRLLMELINIGMEQQVRQSGDAAAVDILNRLITCESSSWQ